MWMTIYLNNTYLNKNIFFITLHFNCTYVLLTPNGSECSVLGLLVFDY